MVKRVILGRTGEEKIVDLITAINDKVSAGYTRPAGTKVLEWDEDFVWSRADGTEHSVRDIDEELEGAKGRIGDAEQSLADSQVRLDEAETTIASTAEDLTHVEAVVIPAAVADLEAADAAAQQELATLDGKLVTAQQDLVTVGENIGQLETDLATESDAREQLAQDVQGTFTELDTRLGAFATDEALAPIRQALTDAQTAVQTAQGVAETANQAANAASQAALEAAGIAASKGRVIIQDTEPTGEDRNAANIWIKPAVDDPDTDITETATTYVYIADSDTWMPTTSDELAQAAQNALDAREAAQQAQQRADTAISNAATAQAAAEAAQRTADDATLDAREAHNEAVEAKRRLEEARGSLVNLTPWGGMENPRVGGDPQSPDGWNQHYDPEGAPPGFNAYVETVLDENQAANVGMNELGDSPVRPDHTYRLTFWVWTDAVSDNLPIGYFPIWRMPDGSSLNTAWGNGYRPGGRSGEMGDVIADPFVSGQWRKVVEDFTPPTRDGVTAIGWIPRMHRWGAGHTGHGADGSAAVGDIWRFTGIRLEDVTDLLAAEAAAKDARDRADEAHALAESKVSPDDMETAISTSANGKNSITRSLQDPFESGAVGAVRGDQWYQVDGYGDAFASWYWGGSGWVASKVRNEMIDTIDVNKLKVHNDLEVVGDAVIEKLWADGIAARSVTASRLAVAPGNIFPDPYFTEESKWSGPSVGVVKGSIPQENVLRIETTTAAQRGSYYGNSSGHVVTYSPGTTYRISFEAKATNPAARLYIYLRTTGPSAGSGYSSGVTLSGGDSWTTYEWTYTYPANPPNGYMGTIGLFTVGPYQANHVIDVRNVRVIPMVGAVTIENGAVGADQIRADEVGAEVGEFVEAEVGNLKATTGTVGSAVINKLWVDGLAAKAITTSRLTVAPGNLAPDPYFSEPEMWGGENREVVVDTAAPGGSAYELTQSSSLTGGYYGGLGNKVISIEGGARYRVRVMARFEDDSIPFVYAYFRMSRRGQSDASYAVQLHRTAEATGQYAYLETEWHANNDIEGMGTVGFFIPGGSGSSSVRVAAPEVTRKASAVLIEDGAITTPKLTVTGDMSAAIVDAMTVSTKRLVVTEDALLNHATLIGQTVVDDINVQGKLIGTDGVFTGTVDFENINVTDQVLADRISGEHLYGTTVEGGEIITTNSGAGQVMLSDTGYVDAGSQLTFPGIRIIPPDMSELVTPPGMGPNGNGFIITGGRNVNGGRGYSIYSPRTTQIRYVTGNASSDVNVSKNLAYIDSDDGLGNKGRLVTTPDYAFARATAADGSYGTIEATSSYALVASLGPGGDFMSSIMSNGREAYMWSTGSDGLGRILSVDSDGVWVKMQRDDGSGHYDHYNLDPKRSTNPFSMPSGWTPDGSANAAKYTIMLGMCYWGGVLKNTGTLSAGWSTIGYAPVEARPREGDQLRALPTSSGKTVLGKISASTGKIEIWLSQSSTGIFMHFSPFTYLV